MKRIASLLAGILLLTGCGCSAPDPVDSTKRSSASSEGTTETTAPSTEQHDSTAAAQESETTVLTETVRTTAAASDQADRPVSGSPAQSEAQSAVTTAETLKTISADENQAAVSKTTTNITRGTVTTSKTTTSKTTTTTTNSKKDPLEEDLGYKLKEIKNVYGAFSGYSSDFYKTFITGHYSGMYGIEMPYGVTTGKNESTFLFTALNYNYIDDDIWSKYFSRLNERGISIENIKTFMDYFASIQKQGDFSLYTVDPEIGSYMNKIQDAYFNGTFKEFMTDQIIKGNIKDKFYNNVGVMCYMCSCDKYHQYLKKADIEKNYMDPLLDTISQKALGRPYQ